MTDDGAASMSGGRQIEKNFRWNFVVNTLDGASFWFGMSFISYTVMLPLYVHHFTSSPLLIGLIPFLYTAGTLVPQLFIANAVERAPRKKFFPVTLGFFLERMPILLMVPAAYFLAGSRPNLALAAFFLLYAWFTFGAGTIIVGWQDLIAKIIPVERRGRFFGVTNFIGNGTGIIGAAALPFLLRRFSFPMGFVYSFAAAAVLVYMSWTFLSLTREPAVKNTKPAISQLEYFRSLPAILRQNRNFRMYLSAQVVFAVSGMATGFLVVYAARTWSLPDSQASGYTIALQVGLAAANLIFGLLADRTGHKLTLEIGMALNVVLLALAIVAPSPIWFFAIFLLRGAVMAIIAVSGTSIVYEFTDAESRATYIGLANTIPGLAGSVAPLIGGWLAGAVSYRAMFILSAVIGTAAWALLAFTVREPRHHDRSVET